MARNESFFQRLTNIRDTCALIPLTNEVHRGVSGIYCIYNDCSNRFYVGSAVNLYNRKSVHLAGLRKNKHHNQFLQRDFNKRGEDTLKFAVLETVKKADLVLVEQVYLDRVFGMANCYNMNKKANSWLGRKHSRETKLKIAKKARGRHVSTNTRKKMSESHKGVPLSATHPIRSGHAEATKKKIRKSMTGKSNHFFGKTHSVETKEKIRQKLLGKHWGPKQQVKAVNIHTHETLMFVSMAAAARQLDISPGHISSVCSGKLKQICGWKFEKVGS